MWIHYSARTFLDKQYSISIILYILYYKTRLFKEFGIRNFRQTRLSNIDFLDFPDFHVLRLSKLEIKPGCLIETFEEKFRPGRLIEQDAS